MKQVNLYEAKTNLSALVDEVEAGAEVIIAKNGKAKVKLTPLEAKDTRPPPKFGFWDHYGWKAPDNFNDPDPEIEALFYGDGTV